MANTLVTLALNWFSNPYHAPIFLGKHLNYYKDVGLDLAILEPTDPSDVTKIIGSASVDIGLKAMIHTIAARTRGYDVVSLGTLLDEPPTGLIFLKSSGIKSFSDIKGRRLGYIGEFGKKIIDDLAYHAGIDCAEYETVRVGMHMVSAIKEERIDAGIGFSNLHQVELEEKIGPASILRIDELAGLGCCCFCSIQIITHKSFMNGREELLKGFLSATQRAAEYIVQDPDGAFSVLCEAHPEMNTPVNKRVFIYTLPFFSRNLLNVERDWMKVRDYTQHLGLHKGDMKLSDCYTNQFLSQGVFDSCALSA